MKHFYKTFLGSAPSWYKNLIFIFLIINPILFLLVNKFAAGWVLLLEFIFTLTMALKCYPLQPGGLIAIEAIAINMASAHDVYDSILENFPVLLLLIFMVSAIYFMKDLLNYIFSSLILKIKSKLFLSIIFCFLGAILSAFLDALTVVAVVITASHSIYDIYHKYTTEQKISHQHIEHETLDKFRNFLRSLLMYAAIGTALGGVMTLVGEPQNIIVATNLKWSFADYFIYVSPVSIPCFFVGIMTCAFVEKFKLFGYGEELPIEIYNILLHSKNDHKISSDEKYKLIIQSIFGIFLIFALSFHLAEVGLIGLALFIFLSSFLGITEEHQLGKAFTESLPFTALLSVFFVIVAVIHKQDLFGPLIDLVIHADPKHQVGILFILNGVLSSISDNVFVATVYITEIMNAFKNGLIPQENLNHLAVAINTGTNLPSVTTPNGQAAFLFLLTSTLAPLVRLSYLRMMWMALPFAITLSITAYFTTVHYAMG